ncbi:unnamed protein product [Rotaria sordida]|uniref:Retrotransposon gag domain-containing protein n=1 Tax=Rotaria sordida TaxID=392033 RepID=A0A814CRX4_9BILA|nr:unnamed protein product [Rotaria sordida]CAF1038970.1 unnamed protein product [Rotaria sordida]
MAKWNDEEKLQCISTQASISIKTWSSFTEAVIKAFGSTKVQELAFEQLKWYKQTVNQPVTQYYDKIIELCKKVDPAMLDSLKLKYLMAGIRESLKLHVALQDPKTTDAFLSLARKIEDTLSFTTTDNEMQQKEININATTTQKSLEQTIIVRGRSSHSVHIFIMNFLRLSEQIPDEASSAKYLQQHGIIQAQIFCKNNYKIKLSLGAKDRWRCYLSGCR